MNAAATPVYELPGNSAWLNVTGEIRHCYVYSAYSYNAPPPTPPPPSPPPLPPPSPPPPSPPPGQPCYSDGIYDYMLLSSHANTFHVPADNVYGSEGGLLTGQGGTERRGRPAADRLCAQPERLRGPTRLP